MPQKQLGALSNDITLGVDIFILTFQGFCSFINGYIIFLFLTRPDLRKNKHMRLVVFLSLGDFLVAIGELPYIAYMVINWGQDLLDYDPWYIMITAQPLPLQLKISATITVGIALSRNIALFFPSIFRRMDLGYYSNCVILIAVLCAIFDDFLYWHTTTIEHHINCGTIGCFVSDQFRYYWGISNMVLGFMAVVLSITIFWKLKVVSKNKSSVASAAGSTSNKYAKANRTSTGILMSSLLFITLPSVCVGVVELSGFSIFKLIGPFYSACLMVSGCCNGIIFITSNWENVRPKKKVSSIIVKKISTAHTQSGLAWH
ncbi:G_PROTEIN_RECEP_F1_2 domain-containing protein [Caenorhabditis elegans]|uniref:G_PROTEIN_RECEP_F1_2 domain-containing protein n=1 Tax=Caenorhabditis elegans TaxID=6239 RepID=Q9UAQ0_CAEEL|nr:G_PROTEIN_RECEP_F1_2 domain-containing protein [Caenorhabditis elegans]CCD71070.1 G_PROTEIN_RECEP_F1_2 domain-containing protein [Caenorhabditis elegans]|eukprot:NP_503335.2 Uncharacterized protein CELE_F41H8.2 [Caenorhabditis elegans]